MTTAAPPRLLLVAHGTRSAEGRAAVEALRDAVVAASPDGVDVALAWVDLLDPTPEDVLADGVTTVVVPCFLAAGYHVRHDVTTAVAGAPGHAVMTPHLGEGIERVLLERLREAGPAPDAVVLAAAGSRDPDSRAETRSLAGRLATRLGVPVEAAFASAAEPSVPAAVAAAREAGHRRVTALSLLLAPGVFADRVAECGADVVTGPFTGRSTGSGELVRMILERYVTAIPGVECGEMRADNQGDMREKEISG